MDDRSYAVILMFAAGVSIWLAYDMYRESKLYRKWDNAPVMKRKK